MESGGSLVAAGAGAWLMHSILMLVGLVAIFSMSVTNFQGAVLAAGAAGYSFLGATIAVLIGSFLLGAGLLVYPSGLDAVAWMDPATGRAVEVRPGTRTKARAAGALSVVYGIQGILAVFFLVSFLGDVAGLDFTRLQGLFQLLLANWLIASLLLIATASLMGSFLSSLRRDIASMDSVGAVGFISYAIINAIAVFFLAGSLLFFASSPTSGAVGLLAIVAIGAFMELLVVPIVGVIAFSLMIPTGLRMRKLQPGPVSMTYPASLLVPVQPYPGYQPMAAAAPFASRGAQPSFEAASDPVSFPPNELELPPPPPDEIPSDPPGSSSWILDMESEIRQLEQSLQEQQRLLLEAEKGWREGRLDGATYVNASRSGRERIVQFERLIAERRAALSDGRDGVVNPP